MNPGPGIQAVVAAVVVATALAGCTQSPPRNRVPDGEDLLFSGDRALRFAQRQMQWPNGSFRYRIPYTAGNNATAEMLWTAWTNEGWDAKLQTFDGPTFLGMDKHPVIEDAMRTQCDETERRRVQNMTFHNVEASLGSGPEVIVSAHYDTKRHATLDPDTPDAPVPGADDGASGVGALWELARVLPGRFRDVTVTLVAFDAEDAWDACLPSAGSTYYANRLNASRRADVIGAINLDMIGNASARFPREGYSRQGAPGLVDLVWGVAEDRGAERFRGETGEIGDDHVPFLHRGVPAVDVIHVTDRGFPPYWHTTDDTPDKIEASVLQEVGRVVEETILRIDRGERPSTGA